MSLFFEFRTGWCVKNVTNCCGTPVSGFLNAIYYADLYSNFKCLDISLSVFESVTSRPVFIDSMARYVEINVLSHYFFIYGTKCHCFCDETQ